MLFVLVTTCRTCTFHLIPSLSHLEHILHCYKVIIAKGKFCPHSNLEFAFLGFLWLVGGWGWPPLAHGLKHFQHFLRNCPQGEFTKPLWWLFNIVSGKGRHATSHSWAIDGQIYGAIWRLHSATRPEWVNGSAESRNMDTRILSLVV